METLIAKIPPSVINAVGRLQFRVPVLQWLLGLTVPRLSRGVGVIAHGAGKGLSFDAEGGYLGYVLGTSEPKEQEMLIKFLGPGSVFYDLGANIGFYAVIGARIVGPDGSVVAFEPFPESAAACRRNADLNDFDWVEVVEAAVADEAGVMGLLSTDGYSQSNRIADFTEVAKLEVNVITVDEWRSKAAARPPDFVMIDVEGAELRALAGMLKTIAECRPAIVVEVHYLGIEFVEFVEREIIPLGYEMTGVSGGVEAHATRWHALLLPSD